MLGLFGPSGFAMGRRLKTASAPDLNLSYQYNEVGKKTHVANLATGSDESYEYDSLSLLKSVLVFKIIDYTFLLVGWSCFCKDDFGFLGLD